MSREERDTCLVYLRDLNLKWTELLKARGESIPVPKWLEDRLPNRSVESFVFDDGDAWYLSITPRVTKTVGSSVDGAPKITERPPPTIHTMQDAAVIETYVHRARDLCSAVPTAIEWLERQTVYPIGIPICQEGTRKGAIVLRGPGVLGLSKELRGLVESIVMDRKITWAGIPAKIPEDFDTSSFADWVKKYRKGSAKFHPAYAAIWVSILLDKDSHQRYLTLTGAKSLPRFLEIKSTAYTNKVTQLIDLAKEPPTEPESDFFDEPGLGRFVRIRKIDFLNLMEEQDVVARHRAGALYVLSELHDAGRLAQSLGFESLAGAPKGLPSGIPPPKLLPSLDTITWGCPGCGTWQRIIDSPDSSCCGCNSRVSAVIQRCPLESHAGGKGKEVVVAPAPDSEQRQPPGGSASSSSKGNPKKKKKSKTPSVGTEPTQSQGDIPGSEKGAVPPEVSGDGESSSDGDKTPISGDLLNQLRAYFNVRTLPPEEWEGMAPSERKAFLKKSPRVPRWALRYARKDPTNVGKIISGDLKAPAPLPVVKERSPQQIWAELKQSYPGAALLHRPITPREKELRKRYDELLGGFAKDAKKYHIPLPRGQTESLSPKKQRATDTAARSSGRQGGVVPGSYRQGSPGSNELRAALSLLKEMGEVFKAFK
ncbi:MULTISPECIES: hypothetical protein [unclassified Providencia]|uniref:hypothetical protein n=1 Tax=unclassified Providencia TaxID=2633465 RepID=UPI00234A8E36|nr:MULTISPECIES: hypothetical protein [unclassified Providencia]